jgi:adenosylcobinamide amidohydrolase
MVATAVVGGGLGERGWWFNTQVSREYHHPDPAAHALRIATDLGLPAHASGVGMLTAADVTRWCSAREDGVFVTATVGLGVPVRAAVPAAEIARETAALVGTINVLVGVPVALADAALVNAVVTVTEAKTQALVEAGIEGTGTSSDAVCIACPAAAPGTAPEPYGGPRSDWGARVARAVHAAVSAGTADWLAVHPPGDEHRRWPPAERPGPRCTSNAEQFRAST